MNKNEEILKVIGSTGTIYILKYLNVHTETQFKELISTISAPAISARLKQLRNLKLVEHHFERLEIRKEWYTITEKGERVLQLIRKLEHYNKNEEIPKVIGLKGTVYILEYLSTHRKTQYKDLNETLTTHTLNDRLQELLDLKLIEHHFVRKEKREEWYTITEKGRKVLHIIQNLKKLPE
jgi:DNA-binding HxlR family transcriptional regulator